MGPFLAILLTAAEPAAPAAAVAPVAEAPPPPAAEAVGAGSNDPYTWFNGKVRLSMGLGTFGEAYPVSSVKVPGLDRGQFTFFAGMQFFLGLSLPYDLRVLVVGAIGYVSTGIFPPRASDGLAEGIGLEVSFDRFLFKPFVRGMYGATVVVLRENAAGTLAYHVGWGSAGVKLSVFEAHLTVGRDFAGGASVGFGVGLRLIY